MARIRTIKPDFWTDEKIGLLKRDERLLFIGMWNLADDQGVVKSSPHYIKGQLFSYDEDLRLNVVITWLSSLEKARFIVPFSFQSEGYYYIRTFASHQLINRPSKPRFTEAFLNNLAHSLNTHGVLTEPSLQEIEGKGNRKEIEEPPPADVPEDLDFKFSDFLKPAWDRWKKYKKSEHRFNYKSIESEQAAINELFTLSNGDEELAAKIIEKSLAKGWKGFFALKNEDNGSSNTGAKKLNRGEAATVSAIAELNRRLELERLRESDLEDDVR